MAKCLPSFPNSPEISKKLGSTEKKTEFFREFLSLKKSGQYWILKIIHEKRESMYSVQVKCVFLQKSIKTKQAKF